MKVKGITVRTEALDAAVRTALLLGKADAQAAIRLTRKPLGALSVVVDRLGCRYERLVGVDETQPSTDTLAASVNARQLAAVVAALHGETTTLALTADGRRLTLTSGAATIGVGVMADLFEPSPVACQASELHASWERLGAALERVSHAISHDETRYTLCGAHLERDGDSLAVVATDGHRLTLTRIPWPKGDVTLPTEGVIVSGDAARVLRHAATTSGHWTVVDGKTFHYSDETQSLVMPLIDGSFPDWRAVVPTADSVVQTVTLSSGALVETVEQAKAIGADGLLLATAADHVDLLARDADGNNVEVRHDVTPEGFTAPIKSKLNHLYLRDAVRAVGGGEVRIALGDELSPVLVTAKGEDAGDERTLCVIMPVRQ